MDGLVVVCPDKRQHGHSQSHTVTANNNTVLQHNCQLLDKYCTQSRQRRNGTTTSLADKFVLVSHGRAPGYLADDFCLAGPSRPGSQSAASMMLDIPRTTTSLGDRAFAIARPRVWNSLPPAIRDPSLSLSIFGKLLKTYLFV